MYRDRLKAATRSMIDRKTLNMSSSSSSSSSKVSVMGPRGLLCLQDMMLPADAAFFQPYTIVLKYIFN